MLYINFYKCNLFVINLLYVLSEKCSAFLLWIPSFDNMIGANGTSGYSGQSRKFRHFGKSDGVDACPSDTVTRGIHVHACASV